MHVQQPTCEVFLPLNLCFEKSSVAIRGFTWQVGECTCSIHTRIRPTFCRSLSVPIHCRGFQRFKIAPTFWIGVERVCSRITLCVQFIFVLQSSRDNMTAIIITLPGAPAVTDLAKQKVSCSYSVSGCWLDST